MPPLSIALLVVTVSLFARIIAEFQCELPLPIEELDADALEHEQLSMRGELIPSLAWLHGDLV